MTSSVPGPFPDSTPSDHGARLSDPDRLAAVARSGLDTSLSEEAFDRAVRLATAMLGVPVGLFAVVDDKRQVFKAQTGLDAPWRDAGETPITHSYCQYVVTVGRPLAVEDSRKHRLLGRNGATRDMGVVAYLGVPVRDPRGHVLGSFCAIDGQPRAWSEADLTALMDLAAMVESEIRLRDEVARREMLMGELNHRVKNLFAVVAGLIGMTARQSDTVADMAAALRTRVQSLGRAHDLIRPTLSLRTGAGTVDLQALLTTLIDPYRRDDEDHVSFGGPKQPLGAEAAANLALILGEFCTNAAKYGALSDSGGRLTVMWETEGDALLLDWTESVVKGPGVPPGHHGFGTRLVELTLQGHFRGVLDTDWRVDGVRHRLHLPLDRLG